MCQCAQTLDFCVEPAVLVAVRAVRAVARGPTAGEGEMRCGSYRSGLSCVVVQYCCAQNARVEPQAVAQDWETQSPVHSACAVAKLLDVRQVVLVSCRSFSQSI
jgi:hypothetical protein